MKVKLLSKTQIYEIDTNKHDNNQQEQGYWLYILFNETFSSDAYQI